MTRAEKAAIAEYPSNVGPAVHGAFIKGYEQAEKDLALTADDVKRIHNLVRKMQFRYNATVGCYPEVAEIFNNERK